MCLALRPHWKVGCYEVKTQDGLIADAVRLIAMFCLVIPNTANGFPTSEFWAFSFQWLGQQFFSVLLSFYSVLLFHQPPTRIRSPSWLCELIFPFSGCFSSLNPHFHLFQVKGKDRAFQQAFGITELRTICLAVGYSPWDRQRTGFWPVSDNLIAHHYPINMLIITPEVGLKQ